MAATSRDRITIDVDTVDQIFNARDANPFALGESAILGEAALEHVLARLQINPMRGLDGAQLVVRLPGDQIAEDLEERLAAAIGRYCAARIEDNRLRVRILRKQRMFGLMIAWAVVLAVILGAVGLFTTVLANVSANAQALAAGGISLFAWVTIWGPLESLLFDWASPARENRALARLLRLQVIVDSRSGQSAGDGDHKATPG